MSDERTTPKPGDFVYLVAGVTSVENQVLVYWEALYAEPVLFVAERNGNAWLHCGMWEGTVAGALRGDLKPTLSRTTMDRVFLRKEDAEASARRLNEEGEKR